MTKKQHVNLQLAAVLNKCPKCGKGSIYCGLLTVTEKCASCGFSLKEQDSGDGPAFFAMLIASVIIITLAAIIDSIKPLSLIIHLVIWAPSTIALSIILLRYIKSLLIALQYKHNVFGFRKK